MKLNQLKLKFEMERLGMNQTRLAAELGLTRQRVSAIFRHGAGTFKVVERIAKVFNVEPKDLLT